MKRKSRFYDVVIKISIRSSIHIKLILFNYKQILLANKKIASKISLE